MFEFMFSLFDLNQTSVEETEKSIKENQRSYSQAYNAYLNKQGYRWNKNK